MYTFIDKSSNAEHSVGTTADALASDCTLYHDNSPHMTNFTCLHTSAKDHNDLTLFFYYYGQRHYSANLTRWINRDPIGENGGVAIYGFLVNNAICLFDTLGNTAPGGVSAGPGWPSFPSEPGAGTGYVYPYLPLPAPAPYSLTMTDDPEDAIVNCGRFMKYFDFHISPSPIRPGVIIQKAEWQWTIKDAAGNVVSPIMSGSAAYTSPQVYWEAFEVMPGGPMIFDTLSWDTFDGKEGEVVFNGTAEYFFDKSVPSTMSVGGHPWSGGLPSVTVFSGSWWATGTARSSDIVHHRLRFKWNCKCQDLDPDDPSRKTQIIENTISYGVFGVVP